MFVAAAVADGETVLTGAEELRVKESDRIKAMATGLKKIGVRARPLPDGIVIDGTPRFKGGVVESFDDHRIAMAFSVAGLVSEDPIEVRNCNNVATSFPGFTALAESIGMTIRVNG